MGKFDESLEKLKAAVEGHQEYQHKSEGLLSAYVTESVHPALRNVLNSLRVYQIDGHQSEAQKVIHYTSISALVSMLRDASTGNKKSSLRLYDSMHFNDPDEGYYFDRQFKLELLKKYDWLGNKDMSHAYIASFVLPADETQNEEDMGNHLLFWRTYGKDGEGCSLLLTIQRCRLQKVRYGPDAVQHSIQELQSVLDLLGPLIEIDSRRIQEGLAEAVWGSLARIRYLHKNKAYEYENECRFVVAESNITDKEKIIFDDEGQSNNPAHIRHYYEHEYFRIKNLFDSDSKITLGPRVSYPDRVKYYLTTLMRRAEIYGPEIMTSDIPYRKP